MSLQHIISTGAEGELAGRTPDDVTVVMNRALRSDRVVTRFHGRLVDEARGMRTAEKASARLHQSRGIPRNLAWRAGAFEIASEGLFDGLVRRVPS